jgi:hypothetical protein
MTIRLDQNDTLSIEYFNGARGLARVEFEQQQRDALESKVGVVVMGREKNHRLQSVSHPNASSGDLFEFRFNESDKTQMIANRCNKVTDT